MALTNASTSSGAGAANEYVSLPIACNGSVTLARNFCGTAHPNALCGTVNHNNGTLGCSSTTGVFYTPRFSLPKGSSVGANYSSGMLTGYYFG
jgi:hypothetical protein